MLTTGLMAAQPNLSGDWTTSGNGPAHTGYFPGQLNGCPFALKWKTTISGPYLWQPAIVGGQLYLSVGYHYSATTLRALDANTGAGIWTNNLAALATLKSPKLSSGAFQFGFTNTPRRQF
jgi:outer membrane protein assembly factor BamB